MEVLRSIFPTDQIGCIIAHNTYFVNRYYVIFLIIE